MREAEISRRIGSAEQFVGGGNLAADRPSRSVAVGLYITLNHALVDVLNVSHPHRLADLSYAVRCATVAIGGLNAMDSTHTPIDLDFLLPDTQQLVNTPIKLYGYVLVLSAHAHHLSLKILFRLKPPFRKCRESVAKPIIVSILPFAKSFEKMLDFSLSKILHVPFG